jgi:hypothetical protein
VRLSPQVRAGEGTGPAEVGLTSRVGAGDATPVIHSCGRCRERHTPARLRPHLGPGKRVRERAAAITGAIAPTKLAARKSVLCNTHGSVYFPRSLSRDAQSATNPCPSVTSPLCRGGLPATPPTSPGRLGHGHSQPGPWPRRPLSPTRLAFLSSGAATPGASFRGPKRPSAAGWCRRRPAPATVCRTASRRWRRSSGGRCTRGRSRRWRTPPCGGFVRPRSVRRRRPAARPRA